MAGAVLMYNLRNGWRIAQIDRSRFYVTNDADRAGSEREQGRTYRYREDARKRVADLEGTMREPTADIVKLTSALLSAVADHGVPNNFPPGELHRLYGGPDPLVAGRIGSMWGDKVNDTLVGSRLTVAYVDRQFRVTSSI